MKKLLAILVIFIILIIIFIVYFFKSNILSFYCESHNLDNCPKMCYMGSSQTYGSFGTTDMICGYNGKNETPSICANEGENIGTCVGCISNCCKDLKPMFPMKFQGGCNKNSAPGIGAICSNCGNNVCDTLNNEDKCNCPNDCN